MVGYQLRKGTASIYRLLLENIDKRIWVQMILMS